jgi:hypothetical protein
LLQRLAWIRSKGIQPGIKKITTKQPRDAATILSEEVPSIIADYSATVVGGGSVAAGDGRRTIEPAVTRAVD